MAKYTVVKCRICGTLFRIYHHQDYEGDPSCCPTCNRESTLQDRQGPSEWKRPYGDS